MRFAESHGEVQGRHHFGKLDCGQICSTGAQVSLRICKGVVNRQWLRLEIWPWASVNAKSLWQTGRAAAEEKLRVGATTEQSNRNRREHGWVGGGGDWRREADERERRDRKSRAT